MTSLGGLCVGWVKGKYLENLAFEEFCYFE